MSGLYQQFTKLSAMLKLPEGSNPSRSARKRNRVRKQKYGRNEVPSVLNSPQKVLNPKGFATQSVAPR